MRTRPGVTLIEVAIAGLITAMTTAAVFSVVLSSFVSHERADKRELAGLMIKQAQKTLMGYVSAVPGEALYTPGSPVGHWPASATAGWSLRGNTAGVTHDISSLINGTDLQFPGTTCVAGSSLCRFTYTVVDQDCGMGTANTALACKRVTFDLLYAN
ncbi:MAG: hypothetical protein RDU13_00030 [Elusimicrobiales bacterium]|nr:hypothetical protein [Elusimicrobiales bacterium]